jgi:hypothetical protein
VLDCWSILSSDREVNVVNVFAGAPDRVKVPLWDSITGAEDSAVRVRERTAEDAAALALANRTPVNLAFLDAQYRRPPGPGLAGIDRAISGAVARASRVHAPAGIGGHPAHKLARRYARMLGRGSPCPLRRAPTACAAGPSGSTPHARRIPQRRRVLASFLEEVPETRRATPDRAPQDDAAAAVAAMLLRHAVRRPAGARGLSRSGDPPPGPLDPLRAPRRSLGGRVDCVRQRVEVACREHLPRRPARRGRACLSR